MLPAAAPRATSPPLSKATANSSSTTSFVPCPDGESVAWLCGVVKTRRHSHLGWAFSGSRAALLLSRSTALFAAGFLTAFLLMQARQHPSGTGAAFGGPTTPRAPAVPERSRMFYNAGWKGGSIELAGPEARYKPQGEHIMLDLWQGDADFLNDMEAMTEASRKLLVDAGMHILSSSSHQLAPQGVSITFTIEESHLTIHTWPEHRAALIDLFTCGTAQLLPILPKLVESFKARMDKAKWSIHFRGERRNTDLQENVLKNRWGSKRMIFTGESEHQQIDVWQNSLDGNTEHLGEEPVNLYLDGSLQSSTGDEHIYHESLIHPAMVLHASGAERVAVVGGGDIAATREVLRHRSVKRVDLVELDPMVSEVTKKHIPQLNDCSFGASVPRSCIDDARVHVHSTDAVGFFAKECKAGGKMYDVLFMDLLDPEQHPTIGNYLYSESHFASLKCALKPDGVFVAQVGDAPSAESGLRLRLGPKVHLIKKVSSLFAPNGTFVYDTYVPSFRGEWSFVVACQSAACVERWRTVSADAVNATLAERLHDKASGLKFFDGAVMSNFQQPSVPWHALL